MKKILFAFSALAIALAVGCSKEDIDIPSPEYKLVVNMDKPTFGDDTRAARTSWESGDVVYVVFNGDAGDKNVNTTLKYLKLTYNDSSWTPEWVGTTAAEVAAKETKTLKAGYMDTEPRSVELWNGGLYFNTEFIGVCCMTCNNGTYTVEGSTITLNMTLKPVVTQITIRNINVADGWKLKCDQLLSIRGIGIGDSAHTSNLGYNDSLRGYANADGVSFYGSPKSGTLSYTFTLSNDSKTYTRTFTDKSLDQGDAVIMDGPTVDDLNGWTDVTPAP